MKSLGSPKTIEQLTLMLILLVLNLAFLISGSVLSTTVELPLEDFCIPFLKYTGDFS